MLGDRPATRTSNLGSSLEGPADPTSENVSRNDAGWVRLAMSPHKGQQSRFRTRL